MDPGEFSRCGEGAQITADRIFGQAKRPGDIAGDDLALIGQEGEQVGFALIGEHGCTKLHDIA